MLDLQPDLSVVATASTGAAAIAAAGKHVPDVVLMDLSMPQMGGAEATRWLTEHLPDVAVVILTTFADEDSILDALDAGARGYLTNEAGRADIARAVRAAVAGQAVLDPAVQQRLTAVAIRSRVTEQAPPGARPHAAELDVLSLIGRGLSNRAIAAGLFVSEATVETHINNLFAKAQLSDRAQAVH